jgi:hypothetical protein
MGKGERYQVYHTIQMLKTRLLQYPGVHIILKMSVVEWQTDAIEAQTGKEFCIIFHEKVFEELVEEKFLFFLS